MTEETKNAATRDASPLLPSAKHRRELSALVALQSAEAQRDGLLEAIEPFAKAWDQSGSAWEAEAQPYKKNGRRTSMQAKVEPEDFRRAKQARDACTRSEG